MSRRQPAGRPSYSDAQRREALDLAAAVGFTEAAQQLAIPAGTLRSWAHRLASTLAVATPPAELRRLASLPWPERRAELLPRLGMVAAKALDKAEAAIDADKGRAAKDFMLTAAIAADKAQLLAGGPTSRSESSSLRVTTTVDQAALADQVARMRAQLGYGDVIEGEVVDGE